MDRLTEKFVFHLPNILKRTGPLFMEKFPYLAMGSLGNFIDFLVQNNPEIPRQIKQEILVPCSFHLRQIIRPRIAVA